MVKNTTGGCKTKGNARKFSAPNLTRSAIRLSKNKFEIYACVVKYFGQGRCSVKTVNDEELSCVIRNKFKGRSKHNNLISVGTILLVGLRDWETPPYKICDVLEVYDNDDYNQLKSITSTNVNNFDKYINHIESTDNDDGFAFGIKTGEGMEEDTKLTKLRRDNDHEDTNVKETQINIDEI